MRAATAVIFTAALVAAPSADACQCGRQRLVSRDIRTATQVFSAIVEVEKEKAVGDPRWKIQTVSMKVNRVWRGDVPEQMLLESGWSNCDVQFEDGREYLVLLDSDRGRLYANRCGSTATMDIARNDLKQLGKSYTPRKLPLSAKVRLWFASLW